MGKRRVLVLNNYPDPPTPTPLSEILYPPLSHAEGGEGAHEKLWGSFYVVVSSSRHIERGAQEVSTLYKRGGGVKIVSDTRFSHTHLHGSPFMVRPRPFPRAHKREASGGLLRTKYSRQSKLERMRERARVNYCLLGKQNRASVYFVAPLSVK